MLPAVDGPPPAVVFRPVWRVLSGFGYRHDRGQPAQSQQNQQKPSD